MDRSVSPSDLNLVRVAVVEGDPKVRPLLAERLSRAEGIEVVGAWASLSEALAALAMTAVDVVVTEASLPDGSGAELCRKVRAERTVGGCVILAGLPGDPSDGVDAYVLKQLLGDDLVAQIHRVAARNSRPA